MKNYYGINKYKFNLIMIIIDVWFYSVYRRSFDLMTNISLYIFKKKLTNFYSLALVVKFYKCFNKHLTMFAENLQKCTFY